MTVIPFSQVSDATVARLTDRQSARHVAEEREELLDTARHIMARPDRFAAQDVRDACIFAQNNGDGLDYLRAEKLLFVLNAEAVKARNRASARMPETPVEVVRAHGALKFAACSVIGAAVLLSFTGWM